MEYEYLSLSVGKLETEWRKNIVGPQDYFELFQASDKAAVLNYFDDDDVVKSKNVPGYRKPLKAVKERLKMLGYNFHRLPAMLHEHMRSFLHEQGDFTGFKPSKFIELLSKINIRNIDWVQHEGDAGYGKFFKRRILTLPEFAPLKAYLETVPKADPYVFEQIDPLIILAALAENPENNQFEVEWRSKAKYPELDKSKTCLVITEGHTDGDLLKKAMGILRPDIADFFEFIDMNENYPFGGAGDMIRFFKGIAKIGTDRQMIFIFDNDAEGLYNFDQLKDVPHPPNMMKFVLPDMPEFKKFKTEGGTSDAEEDVNGRGVAIEMYLDHNYRLKRIPKVVWARPHSSSQVMQGALKTKKAYYDKFMLLEPEDYENYNFSKLRYVIDQFVSQVTS